VVLVIVIAFGIIGTLAGPRWTPQPLDRTIVPQTSDVAIGSDAVTDPVGTYEIDQKTFDVELDGTTIKATLTYPVDAPGERPGVLYMHGAGTGSNEDFHEEATALASSGVYVLVPAKRMDTYSTSSRNYPAMAEDYLVSWRILRDWSGVDPTQVGVYGESEGAWIAPIAAVKEPGVAFVILVSAPIVPPRQQVAFATNSYLHNVGVPQALLRAIPRGLGADVPGGGFEYVDFDPTPWQRQLTQPVLMIYGTDDEAMPTIQGPLTLMDDMAHAGNEQYTVRYFKGANHGIRVDGHLADHLVDVLARWTQGLPKTAFAQPRIAGDQPEQTYRAAPVDHPRWFANGDMLVITLLASLALVLLGPAVWAVSRLVRRPTRALPPPLARMSAALALSTVAILVIFGAYVGYVAELAFNYRTDVLVVNGGWILLHALGIFSVAIGVRSVAALWNAWRTIGRGMLSAGGATIWWASHIGSAALLLIAAYWGVFPAIW